MALSFGVTVLPDPPYQRLVELMVLAESHGFEYGWTYDSHVLWQDSFPVLALAAEATSTMKFGHQVTNPGTRDPTVLASLYATLHDISDGRTVWASTAATPHALHRTPPRRPNGLRERDSEIDQAVP